MTEHTAESGAAHLINDHGNPSNWRRIFCAWWGHEYVGVTSILNGRIGLACLRCYCSSYRVTPPEVGQP